MLFEMGGGIKCQLLMEIPSELHSSGTACKPTPFYTIVRQMQPRSLQAASPFVSLILLFAVFAIRQDVPRDSQSPSAIPLFSYGNVRKVQITISFKRGRGEGHRPGQGRVGHSLLSQRG